MLMSPAVVVFDIHLNANGSIVYVTLTYCVRIKKARLHTHTLTEGGAIDCEEKDYTCPKMPSDEW